MDDTGRDYLIPNWQKREWRKLKFKSNKWFSCFIK